MLKYKAQDYRVLTKGPNSFDNEVQLFIWIHQNYTSCSKILEGISSSSAFKASPTNYNIRFIARWKWNDYCLERLLNQINIDKKKQWGSPQGAGQESDKST